MHIVRASITTALFAAALSGSPTAANAKPTPPLAAYAGTWAPASNAATQCKADPAALYNGLLIITADSIIDGRAPNTFCTAEKVKAYPDGVNVGLVCDFGQESPYNFRTEYAIMRTGPRTLALTKLFVDRKADSLDYVRCDKPPRR